MGGGAARLDVAAEKCCRVVHALLTIPTRRRRPVLTPWTDVRHPCRRGKSHKSLYYGPSRLYALWFCPTPASPSRYYRGPNNSIVHCTPPPAVDAVSKERGLTEKHEAAVGLLEEPAEAPFMDIEELRALAAEGRERGLPDLRGDRHVPRGGRGHEGADLRVPRASGRGGRGHRGAGRSSYARGRGRRRHRAAGPTGPPRRRSRRST